MQPGRMDEVLALLSGETTVADIAHRQGVTEAEVESWKAMFLAGAKAGASGGHSVPSPWKKRQLTAAVIASAASGLCASSASIGQTACTQTLPAPLKTFCANAPAVAGDVNGNFQQL